MLVKTQNGESPTRTILEITAELQFFKVQTATGAIEIGKRLIEAKALLPHGEWLNWLKDEAGLSPSSASRFMRIAKEFSNVSPVRHLEQRSNLSPVTNLEEDSNGTPVSHLPYSSIIALLAVPADEREDFIETKHIIAGEEKTIEEMSRSQLQKAVANWNAEKAAREAAEQRLADKELIIEKADAELRRLNSDKQDLIKRLAVAESRPVDVAVREPSDEEIASYRQEGYTAAVNALSLNPTLPPMQFLENPLVSFEEQLSGSVGAIITAAGYQSGQQGISTLEQAQTMLTAHLSRLSEAQRRLNGFIRAQELNGFEVDF